MRRRAFIQCSIFLSRVLRFNYVLYYIWAYHNHCPLSRAGLNVTTEVGVSVVLSWQVRNAP